MYYNKFGVEYHHHHHHYHQHIGLEWHRFMVRAGMWILMAFNILNGLLGLMGAMSTRYWDVGSSLMIVSIALIGAGIACIPVQANLAYRRRGTADQLLILQIASAILGELVSFMWSGWISLSLITGITLAIVNRCYYSKRIRMFRY